jgi:hypothetical protein
MIMTTKTITLDYPVTLAPHPEARDLVVRRPKLKDVWHAQKTGGGLLEETELHLYGLVAGLAPDVVAEIDLHVDYPKFEAVFDEFRAEGAAKVLPTAVAGGIPLVFALNGLDSLTMRRPKARDEIKAKREEEADSNGPNFETRMFAALTGLSMEELGEIDFLTDFKTMKEAYVNFRQKPAPDMAGAGSTPSASGASASPGSE